MTDMKSSSHSKSRAGFMPGPIRVLLVTGMSGAGKSEALKQLEDMGWEVVDNLPLSLLSSLVRPGNFTAGDAAAGASAFGVDTRTRDFDPNGLVALRTELDAREDVRAETLFFECDDDVLQRRFTETRRRHPLASDRPVSDGIAHERRLLRGVLGAADHVVDTSLMTLPELRLLMSGRFQLGEAPLTVTVTSFSYRHGLPRQSDLVFDVRFLRNPHYDEALRPQTGRDGEVAAFIAADPAFGPFFKAFGDMLVQLMPHYHREGKSYLTIAIGCTGGKHRSVFVAGRVARLLEERGYDVNLRHRDLEETKP